MSAYYDPIRNLTNIYLARLEETTDPEQRIEEAYLRQFLANILLKIDVEVNDYQLNREIAYATRMMIEKGHSNVFKERKYYLEHFWPIDGEDYTDKVPPVNE